MSFDEEDPIENEPKAEEPKIRRPGPITHTPKSGPEIPFKIIVPIILVIAVGIAGYMYYKNKQSKTTETVPVVVNMPSADTTQFQPEIQPPAETTAVQPQGTKPSPSVKKPVAPKGTLASKTKSQPKQKKETSSYDSGNEASPKLTVSTTGKFSIFVGAFKIKKNAENLYGRWKSAGYPSYLTTKGSLYRVSLGKYASKEEARREAEKMHDAFENGYFVDVLP